MDFLWFQKSEVPVKSSQAACIRKSGSILGKVQQALRRSPLILLTVGNEYQDGLEFRIWTYGNVPCSFRVYDRDLAFYIPGGGKAYAGILEGPVPGQSVLQDGLLGLKGPLIYADLVPNMEF